VKPAVITAQCDVQVHRGPDDSGYFIDQDFGFGMRRLSIVDIAGGHQPIVSADRRHLVIFNGEIVNHLELREELAAHGHIFVTSCDTETLLRPIVNGAMRHGQSSRECLPPPFGIAAHARAHIGARSSGH
jgi:asparagine synthetase B (glutamine-hydrolysing)